MRFADSLECLSLRDFRMLFGARTASTLGNTIAPIAVAFAVLDLRGSATDLGIALGAQELAVVAFLLIGGVWADRLSRRVVMVVSDVVRLGAQAVLAALVLTGQAELWHFVVLLAITGAGMAFFVPASTGALAQAVPAEQLPQANALIGLVQSGSSIFGPAVGAAIVVALNPGWAIGINAATFGISALFLFFFRAAEHIRGVPQQFLADLRGGWNEFRSRTWLWAIVLEFALYHLLIAAPWAVLGPVVSKQDYAGAKTWGIILIVHGVGAVLGGVIALRVRIRRPLFVATVTTFAWALPLVALAVTADVWVVSAAAGAAGMAAALFGVLWASTVQREIPAESLARVSAYDYMGSLIFFPIGFALVGPVTGLIGISTTLLVAAAASIVLPVGALLVRDVRTLRA